MRGGKKNKLKDLNINAHYLTKLSSSRRYAPDSLALAVPPEFIFIDMSIAHMGNMFFAWNLAGEMIHFKFPLAIGICSYCFPYERLAYDLLIHAILNPDLPDAGDCFSVAYDLLRKLDLIYRTSEVADEVAVMMHVVARTEKFKKQFQHLHDNFKLTKVKDEISVSDFLNWAQQQYIDNSLKKGGVYIEAYELSKKLLKRYSPSFDKAYVKLCWTSLIDLFDKDLLDWEFSSMEKSFKEQPEAYDRDFRLRRFLQKKRIPAHKIHNNEFYGLVYFPDILSYQLYFSKHHLLPNSFRLNLEAHVVSGANAAFGEFTLMIPELEFSVIESKSGYLGILDSSDAPGRPSNSFRWTLRSLTRLYLANATADALLGIKCLPHETAELTIAEVVADIIQKKNIPVLGTLPEILDDEKYEYAQKMQIALLLKDLANQFPKESNGIKTLDKLLGMSPGSIWTPKAQEFVRRIEEFRLFQAKRGRVIHM